MISAGTVIAAFVFGTIAAYFAHLRKKNPYFWFAIGFFFGAIGMFAIFFLPLKKRRVPRIAKRKTVPVLQGPIDKFWYYLDGNHSQVGPMSYQAVSTALQNGTISRETYVWHEEMSEWKKAEEILRFAERECRT